MLYLFFLDLTVKFPGMRYAIQSVWHNAIVSAFASAVTTASAVTKQEKPTNCGTKAVDVLAIFLPVNFNANQLNILGAFATTMISQHL